MSITDFPRCRDSRIPVDYEWKLRMAVSTNRDHALGQLGVQGGAEMTEHYYLETMAYIRVKEYQEEAARLRLACAAEQRHRENGLHRRFLSILLALRRIAFTESGLARQVRTGASR